MLKPLIKRLSKVNVFRFKSSSPTAQSGQFLDPYWNDDFAQILETWGEKTAWHELDFLMACRSGKVLDIACGTGKNIYDLSKYQELELYGCDISDFLIDKAISRGIQRDYLTVCNAAKLPFDNQYFNFCYSIGSLEHFDLESLGQVIAESARVTKEGAFHMVPVSRNKINNGWIVRNQTYWNNSPQWWEEQFKRHFHNVCALPSLWEDKDSTGMWFLCST